MIFIPVNSPTIRQSLLIVVLEKNNVERMQAADPLTIECKVAGGLMPTIEYPDQLNLMIAYEDRVDWIGELAEKGDLGEIIRRLNRGFKYVEGEDGIEHTTRLPRGKR